MASKYNIDYYDFAEKLFPWVMRESEFYISNGDLAYGDTLEQDIYLILYAGNGNFYQFPRVGLNLQRKLNGLINKVQLRKQIIEALKEDNIIVDTIELITIDDIKRLNITDVDLINKIKKDKLIISINANR
jgi:hypothetical protein